MSTWMRLIVDIGPLAVFFIAFERAGFMTATAAFMVATAISIAVSYGLERRVPLVPVVTGVIVFVFGGLTLWLDNEVFFKMKPTIVQGLFAAVLLGGLAVGRLFLRHVMGSMVQMDEAGWRTLTVRFAMFFVTMACLNELVWRNVPTDTWVQFKVFGILPLTLLFTMLQTPLMSRHQIPEKDTGEL